MSRTTRWLAWFVFDVAMGAVLAWRWTVYKPEQCAAFLSFCGPQPHYRFWLLCIASMVLLGGCLDLMRNSDGLARWQTIGAGLAVLVLMLVGFSS